jgi:hypothetical protein
MWGNVFYVVLSSTQSVNTKIKQLVEVPRTYGTHNFSTESSAFPCTFEVDADGSYCIGLGSSVIQVFLGFDDIEVTDLSAVEVELPTVTTLNGSYTEDDGVLLTWKTPEYDEDQMTILGYNVWYNGEKITETPLQEKTYQNKMTVEEGDKFNVSVVYDLGESELSNDVIISVSGVNVAAQAAVKAYTSHGALLIDNPIGRRITVCNITGAAIYSSSQSGVTTITADKGVYLIMVDGKTTMRVVL